MLPLAAKIDRDRFLLLVAALSAPACGGQRAHTDAPHDAVTVAVPPPDAQAPAAAAPVASEEPPPPPPTAIAQPPRCGDQNDVGTVACPHLRALHLGGPACEGVLGTCALLADGSIYRRRAAETAAACLDRLGRRVCDITARKKCYEEGIRASCPEPKYEAACEATMARCQDAHIRPTYTRDECVQVMSSLRGGDRDWALGAMGPSSEGKCELMFTVF
jgi:hypothetical protein